jgi:hypothetical protein
MPDGLVLGTVSLYSLMDNPRVQEELEISEEQSTKLADYQKDFQGRRQEFMKQVAAKQKEALSADDKEEFLRVNASRNEKFASFAAEADEFLVKKLLDAKQVKRLKEIRIQAEGVGAFKRPEVREALGLTEDQIKEINQLVFNGEKEMILATKSRTAVPKPKTQDKDGPENVNYAKAVAKAESGAAAARVSAMKSIESVLLDNQRVAYRRLIGKVFSFSGPDNKGPSEKTEKGSR